MDRPQFTLKDLLLAVALISLGCYGLGLFLRVNDLPKYAELPAGLFGMTFPIWICTGLAVPFHRKTWGAMAGVGIVFAFGVSMLIVVVRTHRN